MATKERAAYKAVAEAREQLVQGQTPRHTPEDAYDKRGPAPKEPMSLEHAAQAREAARRAQERLAYQREQSA